MYYILAIVLALSAILGISQPASASLPSSEAPISASKDASLPTYLTEVSTSEAPQVPVPPLGAPEVGVPTLQTSPICEEDMPCWDCQTMGNLQCGPAIQPPAMDYCEEDMPCWDCQTMGNRICGPTTAHDAWASYDALAISPDTHEGMTIHYVETLPSEPHTDNMSDLEFALPSITDSTVWHVFSYAPLTTA